MEVDGGQVKLFLGMISRKRGYAADLLFILKGDKAVEMVAFFIIINGHRLGFSLEGAAAGEEDWLFSDGNGGEQAVVLNPVFQKIIAQADCKNSPAVRWGKRDRA